MFDDDISLLVNSRSLRGNVITGFDDPSAQADPPTITDCLRAWTVRWTWPSTLTQCGLMAANDRCRQDKFRDLRLNLYSLRHRLGGLITLELETDWSIRSLVGCVRPLSLFYSDASADEVEERSLVPRSRSHAWLRWNATTSHTF
ncbi:hypothetical protein EVAR_19014_1 [Eumeta japonica]|uniref:Uncharacterized protein n=1 Tax=Eumeta variegata TaxID=151549 RepID=A0A4C1V737_EUMVA|nr:hypothetical protein EVAR_19014_1 [Eumeta japonica]